MDIYLTWTGQTLPVGLLCTRHFNVRTRHTLIKVFPLRMIALWLKHFRNVTFVLFNRGV
jgi:hypothetical protein